MPEATKPAKATEVVEEAAAAEPKTQVEIARDQLQEAEESDAAAQTRAAHVQALQNELDYLTRQPEPNKERVAGVQAQLDEYSDKPTARKRETR
jgi:hypothetical protein